MSDSHKRDAPSRLTPRAVRIRNRCVAVLARRRAIPLPNDAELTTMGNDIGVAELWSRWERMHGGRGAKAPRRMSRMAAVAATAAVTLIVLSATYLTRDLWLPRADAQPAAPVWTPVTDSVTAALDEKLLAVAASDVSMTIPLSPAELASLILRPSIYRPGLPLDSIEARADTLIWIRGRLRDESPFIVGGSVEVVRRGVAVFRIVALGLDGRTEDPRFALRMLRYRTMQRSATNNFWFEIPDGVGGLRLTGGTIRALPWPRDDRWGAEPRHR
jgi:hypothetical protein